MSSAIWFDSSCSSCSLVASLTTRRCSRLDASLLSLLCFVRCGQSQDFRQLFFFTTDLIHTRQIDIDSSVFFPFLERKKTEKNCHSCQQTWNLSSLQMLPSGLCSSAAGSKGRAGFPRPAFRCPLSWGVSLELVATGIRL